MKHWTVLSGQLLHAGAKRCCLLGSVWKINFLRCGHDLRTAQWVCCRTELSFDLVVMLTGDIPIFPLFISEIFDLNSRTRIRSILESGLSEEQHTVAGEQDTIDSS